MAQKVQVVLIDDIDGGSADETVTFALDGARYEIDLTTANAERLRADMADWISKARRVSAAKVATRRSSGSRKGSDAAKIREWARSKGMDVPERGRVSQELRDAYDAAH